MAFFSQSPNGYLKRFKAGILILIVMGLLRMLLQPIGVPIALGGPVISITWALLLCLLVYGFLLGRRAAPAGDVLVLSLMLTAVYTFVDAFGVAASSAFNLDTYYTDPQHMGLDPAVGAHIQGHLYATPFFLVASFAAALLAWVVAKLLSRSP